jgi:phage terminase large subunit-like protein
MPDGDWETWLVLAGRSFGKTHLAAENTRMMVERGLWGRIALIGPTAADCRDVMVEGKSGLVTLAPPWFRPKYEPSKRRLTWPNGARAFLFSAEEPERLRGPQHDGAWCDEIAAWGDGEETWRQMKMGLRLGEHPRAIATTTPKPVPLILSLMKDSKTVLTRGSTFENTTMPKQWLDSMRRTFEGTRMGRQEMYAEVLEDVAGALFNQVLIDNARIDAAPELERIVIAVDPPLTSNGGSDECGIMAVGRGGPPAGSTIEGHHGYVLKDHTVRGTPDEWARAAVKAFYEHKAECIVAEVNCGGDMVETVIRSVASDVPFKPVRAMRGKYKRAEPVAALYEQKKVHHVGPTENWERLEKQMRVFTGVNGRRDDRTDALCWGLHELIVESAFVGFL